MTMPHLMNCPHSEDGWCLDCVKVLWDEKEQQSWAADFISRERNSAQAKLDAIEDIVRKDAKECENLLDDFALGLE